MHIPLVSVSPITKTVSSVSKISYSTPALGIKLLNYPQSITQVASLPFRILRHTNASLFSSVSFMKYLSIQMTGDKKRSNAPEVIGLVRRCIRLYIEKHQNKTFWAKTSLSFAFRGPNSVHSEVFRHANHNGTSFKAV